MTGAKTAESVAAASVINELELAALEQGSPTQRERHAAHVLPEDELLTIVRAELFKELNGLPRWALGRARETMAKELRHTGHEHAPQLTFETGEVTELSAAPWEALKKINLAVSRTNQHPWLARGGCASIEIATHWVTCICEAEVSRSWAKVTIEWAGRVLVREYVL